VEVPADITLAIQLRDARHAANLTRASLAAVAVVPEKTIDDIEDALATVSLDHVVRIADVLGMRPVIDLDRPGEAVGLTRRRGRHV
jgi:predicted transcriptional regulator